MKTVYPQIRLLLLSVVILVDGCWKHQDNQVTAPETPVYTISGKTLSSDNGEPVEGAVVSWQGEVKYLDQDTTTIFFVQDTTDEGGHYQFDNVPAHAYYNLTTQKEGYQTYSDVYMVFYKDRVLANIVLGKWLSVVDSDFLPNYTPSGIAWDGGSLWVVDSTHSILFEYRPDSTFVLEYSYPISGIHPQGLAWDGVYLWSTDPSLDSLFRLEVIPGVGVDEMGFSATPTNPYYPEERLDLLDFVWVNGNLWACSPGTPTEYLRFSPPDTAADYFDSPMYHPKGIAWDGSKILLACYYHGEGRLYFFNPEGSTTPRYCIIPGDAGPITWDGTCLWLIEGRTIKKYRF